MIIRKLLLFAALFVIAGVTVAQAQTGAPAVDPMVKAAIQAAAATVLGYVWQWARAQHSIHNAVSWVGFAVAAAVLYVWQDFSIAEADWRATGLGIYTFILSARGVASTSSEIKVAPPTKP